MNFRKVLKKTLKRRSPYAPVALLGRKTVEQCLSAKIKKNSTVEKELSKS